MIHTQWCTKCSQPFTWDDLEDECALPPSVCVRCIAAQNTPIPKPFLDALKDANLEV